jgi:hypothetical protein
MSKEQQELLYEAYENYTKYPLATIHDHRTNILYQNRDKGWCVLNGLSIVPPNPTRYLTQEEFINKCKTDNEFSERWGLKIEERELSLEERYNMWFNNNYETGMERFFDPNKLPDFDDPYYEPTPTKLITISYNDRKL